MELFTIGHSNHPIGKLLELLQQHGIAVLADVRSSPYSRFATQYNREDLAEAVERAGMRYVFLGEELGGRPEGDEFYDDEGHVLYGRIARTRWFERGLEQLLELGRGARTAMMCSEEDPRHCHRRLLVARVLCDRDVAVTHIRADGGVEFETDLRAREVAVPKQLALFADPEEQTWKSIRSVSPRSRPIHFSDF
jgi:uncharacterized protein (DUF488 family)